MFTRFFWQGALTMSRKRQLDIPPCRSRYWLLPALIYWEEQRLARLDAAVDSYACPSAWKRRTRAVEGRIARLKAEFRDLHEGNPA